MANLKEVAHLPNWLVAGVPDEFADYLDRARDELPLADFSDDELANRVYMVGDISAEMDAANMINAHRNGERYISRLVALTAAKERLRWLSRKLLVAEGKYPGKEKSLQIDAEKVWEFILKNDLTGGHDVNALRERAMEVLPPEFVEEKMQPILESHVSKGYMTPDGTINVPLMNEKQYKGLMPGQVERDAEVERRAEAIYNSWTNLAGFTPWVPRGNSDKQEEARRQARGQLRREELTPTPPIIP